MSFRTDLLKRIDQIRSKVPNSLDLRQFNVTVRIRSWSGSRVGLGTATDKDTQIVHFGGYTIKVTKLTDKDVIASGGKYSDRDLRVGPLTPKYPGGGVDTTVFDPPVGSTPQELFFHVVGPGIDDWFQQIGQETDKNFSYFIILRAAAQTP